MSSVVFKFAWTSDPPNPAKGVDTAKITQNLVEEALQNCRELMDKKGTFFVLIRKEAHATRSTVHLGTERILVPEGGLPRITFTVYGFGEGQNNWDTTLQNLQTFFSAHLHTNNAKTKTATTDEIEDWNKELQDRNVKWTCKEPLDIFDEVQTGRADLQQYIKRVKKRQEGNAKGTFERPL